MGNTELTNCCAQRDTEFKDVLKDKFKKRINQ